MLEPVGIRLRRRLAVALRNPLALIGLLGWLLPLASAAYCTYKDATFTPVSDADNWNRLGYDWGREASLLLAGIWFALAAVGLALDVLVARPRRIIGYCAKCGYDLTGNTTGRCPECGTAIPT